MANNQTPKLKAFVRFDGTGRVVPGSLVLQASKPKVGDWKEIPATECCGPTTTTTSTSTSTTTSTTSTSTSTTTTTTTAAAGDTYWLGNMYPSGGCAGSPSGVDVSFVVSSGATPIVGKWYRLNGVPGSQIIQITAPSSFNPMASTFLNNTAYDNCIDVPV